MASIVDGRERVISILGPRDVSELARSMQDETVSVDPLIYYDFGDL